MLSSFWKLGCERREEARVVRAFRSEESFVLLLGFQMRALCVSQGCWGGGGSKEKLNTPQTVSLPARFTEDSGRGVRFKVGRGSRGWLVRVPEDFLEVVYLRPGQKRPLPYA